MKLSAFGRTNRNFGSGPWRALADMIEVDLPVFGDAIQQVWITIYCNGDAPAPSELAWLIDAIPKHLQGSNKFPPLYLEPKTTFFRKRKELKIQFPSTRFTPSEGAELGVDNLTRDHLHEAKLDLRDALHWGLTKSVKKSDAFDPVAFLRWFDAWPGLELNLHRPVADLVREAWSEKTRRQEAADPWSTLDVSWDRMHPDARKILDRLEDWSQIDDLSPHGNDTGADIWAQWSQYGRMTPTGVARSMGWDATSPAMRETMARDWLEIHLALAFGHLKRKGSCPHGIAIATIELLEEERADASFISPERLRDWHSRIERYKSILAVFIHRKP